MGNVMPALFNSQRGSVLLVSLVLLLIVTLLGTAAMQGATLESKMTSNSQARQQAFNSAEAALRQAERFIDEGHIDDADLRDGCSGSYCFNATCNGGFCFEGEFAAATPDNLCSTVDTTSGVAPPAVGVWARSGLDVWNNAGRHRVVSLPAGLSGKYIVEFRCFTDSLSPPTPYGDIVYRITARGTSKSGQVEAMVQSTYRAARP